MRLAGLSFVCSQQTALTIVAPVATNSDHPSDIQKKKISAPSSGELISYKLSGMDTRNGQKPLIDVWAIGPDRIKKRSRF
jgi:hypothetical protein